MASQNLILTKNWIIRFLLIFFSILNIWSCWNVKKTEITIFWVQFLKKKYFPRFFSTEKKKMLNKKIRIMENWISAKKQNPRTVIMSDIGSYQFLHICMTKCHSWWRYYFFWIVLININNFVRIAPQNGFFGHGKKPSKSLSQFKNC